MPSRDLPEMPVGNFDKIVHFSMYFVLSVLLMKAMYYHSRSLTGGKVFLFTLIIVGMYGILMELFQSFVPGRTPSLADVLANVAGILAANALRKVIICRK